METGALETLGCGRRVTWSGLERAPAHGRDDPRRNGDGRPDHRRHAGPAYARHGAALFEAGKSSPQAHGSRREFRCRSEQKAHESCQTYRLEGSGLLSW